MPDLGIDIAYFSRGRGRGHAIPDIAIIAELYKLDPHIKVRVYTYGTGLSVFRQTDIDTFDLGLDNFCNPWEVLHAAGQILRSEVKLVVSHEEFGVIPAAKLLGRTSLFLTHWFGPENSPDMQAIVNADRVLLMEKQGLFEVPRALEQKVKYVPSVLRHFIVSPSDRESRRDQLMVTDEIVFLVFPGSWEGWQQANSELLLEAIDSVNADKKRVFWLAGSEYQLVREMLAKKPVTVIPSISHPEELIVAADVAIISGTYNIGREVSAFGIPIICISEGKNPIDDYFAKLLPNSTFYYLTEAGSSDLALAITVALKAGRAQGDYSALSGAGATQVAREIIEAYQAT